MDAPSTSDAISAGRARIDELDEQIVALVQQRVATSREIQQARLAEGGRRVAHSRELQIVDRYVQAFGEPGARLAMTLLEIARGRTDR